MSDTNWSSAPPDAQLWGPETAKFMSGWYRKDLMGRWYFSRTKASGWWKVEPPSAYRLRQMEKRP